MATKVQLVLYLSHENITFGIIHFWPQTSVRVCNENFSTAII